LRSLRARAAAAAATGAHGSGSDSVTPRVGNGRVQEVVHAMLPWRMVLRMGNRIKNRAEARGLRD
jgi:hypothetical protein